MTVEKKLISNDGVDYTPLLLIILSVVKSVIMKRRQNFLTKSDYRFRHVLKIASISLYNDDRDFSFIANFCAQFHVFERILQIKLKSRTKISRHVRDSIYSKNLVSTLTI